MRILTLSASVLFLVSACGPKKGESDPNAIKDQAGDIEPPVCGDGEFKVRVAKTLLAPPTAATTLTTDDPRGAPADDPAATPETEREVVIEYDDFDAKVESMEIMNSGNGGHFLFTMEDGAKSVVAWQESSPKEGDTVGARGYFKNDSIDMGNCEDPAVFSSKVTFTKFFESESHAGTFVLRKLHKDPYCEGEELIGTIAGCYDQPDN